MILTFDIDVGFKKKYTKKQIIISNIVYIAFESDSKIVKITNHFQNHHKIYF